MEVSRSVDALYNGGQGRGKGFWEFTTELKIVFLFGEESIFKKALYPSHDCPPKFAVDGPYENPWTGHN
ncbi:MAG TPA: hypothetical protein ENH60_09545 [Pricia sp.]|nr:hypothetical protein [Pricia sp.]